VGNLLILINILSYTPLAEGFLVGSQHWSEEVLEILQEIHTDLNYILKSKSILKA